MDQIYLKSGRIGFTSARSSSLISESNGSYWIRTYIPSSSIRIGRTEKSLDWTTAEGHQVRLTRPLQTRILKIELHYIRISHQLLGSSSHSVKWSTSRVLTSIPGPLRIFLEGLTYPGVPIKMGPSFALTTTRTNFSTFLEGRT